jgi:hypothetical protein
MLIDLISNIFSKKDGSEYKVEITKKLASDCTDGQDKEILRLTKDVMELMTKVKYSTGCSALANVTYFILKGIDDKGFRDFNCMVIRETINKIIDEIERMG